MRFGGVLDQDAMFYPIEERSHLGVTGTVAVEILEASVEIIAYRAYFQAQSSKGTA